MCAILYIPLIFKNGLKSYIPYGVPQGLILGLILFFIIQVSCECLENITDLMWNNYF